MWWYGYGWWWWWIAFLLIFFLLPQGWGWGYRRRGPWYRRRHSGRLQTGENLPENGFANAQTGWAWGGVVLWIILLVASSGSLRPSCGVAGGEFAGSGGMI